MTVSHHSERLDIDAVDVGTFHLSTNQTLGFSHQAQAVVS